MSSAVRKWLRAATRRLFDLYARGMTLELSDRDAVIKRTDGVTASFFRELLRHALLEAVEDDSGVVRDRHVAAGLERLLNTTNEMTRVLLGATPHKPTAGFRGPEVPF